MGRDTDGRVQVLLHRSPSLSRGASEVPASRSARLASRWGGFVGRHVGALTAAMVLATVVLGAGLPGLEFRSSQDTMVSPDSEIYQVNQRYQRSFGGEVMIVLFEGDIHRLVTPENRAELDRLTRALERTGRFHAIIGPDTVLEFAADQIEVSAPLVIAAHQRDLEAATNEEERERIAAEFQARVAADGQRLVAAGDLSLENPAFVDFLLLGADGEIREAQRGAFPDGEHALLVLRLRGNLSLDDQAKTVTEVNRMLDDARFTGLDATATGTAALLKEINDRMRNDMARTGLLALVVMVVVLLVVFRARWRLLPLPLVAIGMVWAFGAFGYLGIPLNMVTISGLPILVGLGVDFAIQVHARYEEKGTGGEAEPLPAALASIGPALVVALVAAAVGFLALRISSVPMIQQFAVMLAVGVAVILVAVLALVPVALVWRDRRSGYRAPKAGRVGVERLVRGLTSSAGTHTATVVAVALVIAVAGFEAQRDAPVESDPEKFVASDSPVLRDLHRLRDIAGTSADIGVMVEADEVLRADVLRWMAAYEQRQLERHPDELLQSSSVASLTAQITGSTPTPEDVRAVLAAAPDGISRTFLDPDGTRAQMLFSAGHLTMDEQAALLAAMERDVDAPPGVRVAASGLTVLGIETARGLEHGRTQTTVAALVAVFAWLLVAFRSLRRALMALLPVVTAVGAASLVIDLLGVTVSALGALSAALVIAVATEFSVLILERYDEERRRGRPPDAAVAAASLSIGRAFTASGLTIAGGFAALALSGFPMVSNFGVVVAVNILVAMLCALVILPPLMRAAEAAPSPQARSERARLSVSANEEPGVVTGQGVG